VWNAHLLLLLAYSIALIALGLAVGRRVDSTGKFFVAGRSLGPVLLGATLLAANIGAGSTVGAAAIGYQYGLSAWWWVGSAGIGTVLLALGVGPMIWRVARDRNLLTVGDYLEWRYNARVRLVATLLLWVGSPAVLAAQLVAVGVILDAVAGIPFTWGCIIAGVVMTTYFTAGGLVASAWVNLLQLVVLAAGLLLALPFAARASGGAAAIAASIPDADLLAFSSAEGPGWHYALLLVPAFMVSPGILQKIYGARDEKAVRRGVGVAGIALLAFAIVPVLLGIYARYWEPALAGAGVDQALPLLLILGLPAFLGGLGLAAVLSAEISSADAVLFMLSTSLSEDLYRRFVRPDATDARVLAVARGGAVIGGIAGTLLAVQLASVIESLTIFYSLLSVSLFVPVVGGLLWQRPGGRAGMAALLAGVTGYLLGRYGLALPARDLWSPNTMGLVSSAVAFGLTALLPAQNSTARD
jgi:SSS family solute:Na+ symporter